MAKKKITDQIHSELLALQDLAVGDIRFYKEQQWRICNHALVLYAALIAVVQLIDPCKLGSCEYFGLGFLALVIFVAGVLLIRDMGKSLAKGRDRLPALRKHFNKKISLRAYAAGDDPCIALHGSEDKISLEWFFYCVLFIGLILTLWILFRFSHFELINTVV